MSCLSLNISSQVSLFFHGGFGGLPQFGGVWGVSPHRGRSPHRTHLGGFGGFPPQYRRANIFLLFCACNKGFELGSNRKCEFICSLECLNGKCQFEDIESFFCSCDEG